MEIFSLFAFFILFVLALIYIFNQSKSKPSSPLALPILGHLHLIVKKPFHRTLTKLAEQHGPVLFLRYGFRKVLLVSSPSAVEECLSKNDTAFGNRPRFIVGEILGYNFTSLVFVPCGDHWRNLRRLVALEMSSSRLQFSSNVQKQEIHSLVVRLLGNSDGKKFHKVEFQTLFFDLMLNTMMRIIAGKRYYGENVVDLYEARQFQQVVAETFYLVGIPNIADFLPFLRWFDLQGLEKRMVKLRKERKSFMQNLIDKGREKRQEEGHEENTMIDVLLSQQEIDPDYYTDEILIGIIGTMLTGGTDTSSETMEWAMSLLLNHPEYFHKARDEMDTHVGKNRLLDESDLPSLPYLNNIISETLRLYPTGPITTRESSKDCTVGGLHVPQGTMLQLNFWAVHRDPNVWIDPMKFSPERFEGAGGGKEGFKWIPFSSGRRRCPGEAFAMRMVGLALGSLIQCFEWKRVGEEMVDMSEGTGLTLPRAKPLVAMCKPRLAMKHIINQI